MARKCARFCQFTCRVSISPEVGLIHKRRGLQGIPCPLPSHAAPGNPLELLVNERGKAGERGVVAVAPRQEKPGNFAGRHMQRRHFTPVSSGSQFLAAVPASRAEGGHGMATRARLATAAMVVAMTLMSARSTAAGQETLTLALRVENYAGVSAEILGAAEEQAARIYHDIGVRTIWVHDGSTDPEPQTRHLGVLILSRDMAQRQIGAGKLGDHVLGVGNPDTGRAHIFADRIAAVAAKKQRDVASVLGLVLAHEVGHMVLPPHSHSCTGIMREESGGI